MTDIQIRNTEDRDGELIVRFLRAALQDMEAAGGPAINSDEKFWRDYTEQVSKTIQPDGHLYLLAQTENAAVGYLEGKASTRHGVFAFKKYFHLSAVYVVPEARNQGIATILVQKALGYAAEQGCREADLNVLVNNSSAKGLYNKLGFKVFRYEMRMQLPTHR